MLLPRAIAALLLLAAPALACPGDCDGDGTVAIAELVRAVDLALDGGTLAACAAADGNGDDQLTVDELIDAVGAALDGCPPPLSCQGAAAPGTPPTTVLVTDALSLPVHIGAPPLDMHRVFIVEQSGRIRIVKDGALLATPFLAIEPRVSCCGERGLLSVAFHPDYASNGRFFVNYTNTAGNTVIARYQVGDDPDRADPDSEQILITIAQPFANHNGGQLAFGPDGYLYAGMGDGGLGGDPQDNAQDDASLLGKLLRFDVDVEPPPYYAVPPTNPRAGDGARLGLIWAKGLRNPWRFSFDRATGDLYIADVGQDRFEEIDVQPAASHGGENYGWDIFEGNACFEPAPFPTCPDQVPPDFTPPLLTYGRSTGCSITGGFVYRGCALPDLQGEYFFSDYCTAFLRTFRLVDGVVTDLRDRTAELAPHGDTGAIATVSSFGEDAQGELYIADLGGQVFKIAPAPVVR
ncbi:MAG: PQQ-dependent sugar dehydrogenase [Deltaproteobacteria bacterium]|nr:PQQ-dependent sugar dehydrogenase [Deltaproteobacteria bacterium]